MGKIRKLWSNDQLLLAISAIRSGESIGNVSRRTGIPKSTLSNKLSGKYSLNKGVGPGTVLTSEEEQMIVQWILHWSSRGFPITKTQVINNVGNIVKKLNRDTPFTNDCPGRHWYEGFLRRHPDAFCCVKKNVTITRASITEEKLKTWFQEVKVNLDKIGIDSFDGSRIFNLNESVFFLCSKGDETLTSSAQNEEKECLTVLFTTNAIGSLSPPMVLFKFENIPYSSNQTAADLAMGISGNGWMTAETFYEYITNIFHPWLTKNNIQRPVVLYVDGHSSHVTYPTAQFCLENQIELISLFPNSTHILQPLDATLFKPLKEAWKHIILDFRTQKQSRIRKEDFCLILKSAVDSLNLSNIMCNGFRKTGVYHFSRNAFKNGLFRKNPFIVSTTIEEDQKNIEVAKVVLEYSETIIDGKLLEEFQLAEKNGIWTGDPKHESLFFFWLTTLKRSRGETTIPTFEDNVFSNNSQDEANDSVNLILVDNEINENISTNNLELIYQLDETNFDVTFNHLYVLPDKTDYKESKISIVDNSRKTLMESTLQQSSTDSLRLTNATTNFETLVSGTHNEYRNIPTTAKSIIDIPPNVPDIIKKSLFWPRMKNVSEKKKRKRNDVEPSIELQEFHQAEETENCKQQTDYQ